MKTKRIPDRIVQALRQQWLEKLSDALTCHPKHRSPETPAKYLRTLKMYANLIVRDEVPKATRPREGGLSQFEA
jgi:hypothetical protein